MASILKVDELQNSAGQPILANGYLRRPGQIIETIAGVCDGSVAYGETGSYALQNVTGVQVLTTAYADATGSVISYTPPPGTSRVIYEYNAFLGWADAHAISHWKLFIDGTEVVYARTSRSGYYPEDRYTFMWVFSIGSANTNTGAQQTWTNPKEIKWQVRDYSTGNRRYRLHNTTYWDGAGGNQFSMPTIRITAIA